MKVGDLVLPMRFFCDMREDAGCRMREQFILPGVLFLWQ